MINVVIIMWQGLIEEVRAFREEESAFRFFDTTGVSWEEYSRRIQTEDSETILADYAGSTIYELEVE